MPDPTVRSIVLAHHFVSPPGWCGTDHAFRRQSSGIVYVLDGSAEYVMADGTRFRVHAGDCICIPTGSVYTTLCGAQDSFTHMTVNYELTGAEEFFPTLTRRRLSHPAPFEQLFSRLIHHWTVRHPFYRERCLGLLYEMLHYLLKETAQPAEPYLRKLLPARVYLDEHFTEDFELRTLPALCGLSEPYFRRLFLRVFHETPAAYRRRLRISHAETLLLSGSYTVSQTAQRCGYSDPAYFSRIFRKTLGLSPQQYLAAHFPGDEMPSDPDPA